MDADSVSAVAASGWRLLVLVVAAAVFGVQLLSPISQTGSDPRFSLVVSQAIWQEGTVRLDNQLDNLSQRAQADHRIVADGGHYYYSFPWGTSLFMAPIIPLARWYGLDVTRPLDDGRLQNGLSAATGALVFLVAYGILRCYLVPRTSLTLAVLLVTGSALMSTIGAALWNLNLATLFVLLAVWLLARHHSGRSQTVHPLPLGVVLFAAYLTRPTTAVFIFIALLYLAWRDRRALLITAGAVLALLLLFMAYSWGELGVLLPPYYFPARLQASRTPLSLALEGLLVSPSRGLFVYSPIFLWTGLGGLWLLARRPREILPWLLLTWMALHVYMVARFDHWWGGLSFGPRLLTDMMPAFVWLTAVFWSTAPAVLSTTWRRLILTLLLPLAAFSIYLNTAVGLYHSASYTWPGGSMPPTVDRAPGVLFDWQHPQWLATDDSHCIHNSAYLSRVESSLVELAPITTKLAVSARAANALSDVFEMPFAAQTASRPVSSPGPHKRFLPILARNAPFLALFPGWEYPVGDEMATGCTPAAIVTGPLQESTADRYVLALSLRATMPQSVDIWVNGRWIGELRVAAGTAVYTLDVPAGLLLADQRNRIAVTAGSTSDEIAVWPRQPLFLRHFQLAPAP